MADPEAERIAKEFEHLPSDADPQTSLLSPADQLRVAAGVLDAVEVMPKTSPRRLALLRLVHATVDRVSTDLGGLLAIARSQGKAP